MKKIHFLVLLSIFSLSLFSCHWGNNENNKDDPQNQENPNSQGRIDVKFNMSGAKALGIVESSGSYKSARDAAENPGGIVKITDQGAEAFITVPEWVNLSTVESIWTNPSANNKDVYILFQSKTQQYYDNEYDEETDTWTNKYYELGQFIRVKEDSSYDDIIYLIDTEDSETERNVSYYNSDPVKFDKNGNVYFLVNERINSISSSIIYKFDPVAATVTPMTVPAPNMAYEKFTISPDAVNMFVKGMSGNGYGFLRVIPTANPKSYYDVDYQQYNVSDFYYDDETSSLFIYKTSNGMMGLSRIIKGEDGKFSMDAAKNLVMNMPNGMEFYPEFYMYKYQKCKVADKYESDRKANGDYNYEEMLDDMFARFKKIKRETHEFKLDYLQYHTDYKELYIETEGKVNEEALKIIIAKPKLLNMFHSYIFHVDNNAFADNPLYTLFPKKADGMTDYESLTIQESDIFVNKVDETIYYDFNYDYSNPTDYLNFLFSKCRVKGKKYFTLKNMADFTGYDSLVTDKINEDAINWLKEDNARMEKFYNFFSHNTENNASYLDGNSNNLFLYKTCFIEGTDEPAYRMRKNPPIYDTMGSVNNLFRTSKGLFGMCYTYGQDSSHYIIQILDEENQVVMEIPDSLTKNKPNNFQSCKDGFVFDERPDLTAGSGYGFKLFYYNIDKDEVSDLFTKLEDRNSFELFSFTALYDEVYYSGVSGFDFVTCKVNIDTLDTEISNIAYKLKDIVPLK